LKFEVFTAEEKLNNIVFLYKYEMECIIRKREPMKCLGDNNILFYIYYIMLTVYDIRGYYYIVPNIGRLYSYNSTWIL